MANQNLALANEFNAPNRSVNKVSDVSEVKQRLQYHEVDESLSEWELARMTSKTWSMEQE